MIGKRIYWIDIYKAATIILVVIGHSTGKFNAYIYQFHVAAFFFISGYVSKMDKECLGKELYKKFMSLIVPLFTMVVIFGIVIEALKEAGIYDIFYETGTVPNKLYLINNFIVNGSMIDLLGAAWFLEVLFSTAILSHILYIISRKNIAIFSFITMLVYLFGYYKMKNTGGHIYGIDLALIAQGYYGMAFSVKNIMLHNKKKTGGQQNIVLLRTIVFFSLTSIIMYIMKTYFPSKSIMDLANRQIHNIYWSTAAVVNGIICLYTLSKLISYINIDVLIKTFNIIGKNTMGIMLLHFFFFRIVSYILFKIGMAPLEACKNLVPPPEIGNRFWMIYAVVAVTGSILIWTAFRKVPVLNQLLGLNKSYMDKIPEFEPCRQVVKLYDIVTKALSNAWKDYVKYLAMPKHKMVFYAMTAAAIILILIGSRFVPPINGDNNLNIVSGTVTVEFPYNGNAIEFKDGWLPQTNDEKYRWVAQESEFAICLGEQSKIRLSGYVPAEVENLSKMELYMNGNIIVECDIRVEEQINIEADFAAYKIEDENVFKIIFDGIRTPKTGDADQRSFSAMFTSIVIE